MFSEVAKIGPITIHGYGLMIAIGLLCAIILANYRAGKKGLDKDFVFNLYIVAIVFGFLGAKIFFLLVNFGEFIKEPLKYLLSGEGFVVYGGIILGVLSSVLYCRIKKVNFLKYFDLLMPSVSVAQGFGRLGCLGAGCCYGQRTDSFFSIVFHHSHIAPNNVPLIPTQIISSVGNFIIAGLLLLYARKDRRAGSVGLLYLMLYGTGRFIVEFFRYDYTHAIWFMTVSQFISVIAVLIATVVFFIWRRNGKKDEKEDKETTKA